MKRIGDVFEELSKSVPLFSEIKVRLIVSEWREIVGDLIARHTKVKKVENGVVYVLCDDPIWVAELSLQRRKIVEKLNKKAGENIFRDVVFRRG